MDSRREVPPQSEGFPQNSSFNPLECTTTPKAPNNGKIVTAEQQKPNQNKRNRERERERVFYTSRPPPLEQLVA